MCNQILIGSPLIQKTSIEADSDIIIGTDTPTEIDFIGDKDLLKLMSYAEFTDFWLQ